LNDENKDEHVSVGYENISLASPMKLFPNPAKDYVIVTFDAEVLKTKHVVLLISDMKGSVIYRQKLTGKEAQYKLSTSSWPKGVYSVSLIGSGGETRNLKLVIE
jgi:hypothetical protein